MEQMKFGVGQSVLRVEDRRLLRGEGRYIGDVSQPDQAYMQVVRSTHASARIRRIDFAEALRAPGVCTILTAAEYFGDGHGVPEVDFLNIEGGTFRYRAGTSLQLATNVVLARDRVRHVGDNVAIVVADTPDQARDAAELVWVEYEPLPAVVDMRAALSPNAPRVWDDISGNLCADVEYGSEQDCEAVFAKARHVVRIDIVNNRVIINPMEPRGVVAAYDPASDSYTIYTNSQLPHRVRTVVAKDGLRVDENRVRVICGDMGGGFGGRGAPYAECILAAWAARRVRRPVKWICERSEGFISDTQGRDNLTHAELALDADGTFLALRVETIANMGAYPGRVGPMVPVVLGPRVQVTNYTTPVVYARIRVAYTNTVTVMPYRGAGQPEAVYVMERLIDVATRQTGIDAIALRRRNHIPSDAMPYATPVNVIYDSGDYDANLSKALTLADWDWFDARKAEARRRGVLRGRGLANYIQVAAGVPFEWSRIHVRGDGKVDLYTGTFNHGQGHETSFAQLLVHHLGVPFESVRLIQGDTGQVPRGQGTHGSRSMVLVSPLVARNADIIVKRGKRIAAERFEAAEEDIVFADGGFHVAGTHLTLSLFEIAAAAESEASLPEDLRGPLQAEFDYRIPDATYPSGTHVCEVEVDPETGAVKVVAFTAIDDVGRAINPMIVFGQSHGGIAQGVGQAMLEDCRYDMETGQLLSGSLLDYCLPRADDLPSIAVALHEALSPTNPLGVKGAGESGSTGAPPAVINAIVDALDELGVTHIDMPATPERVWRAIRGALSVQR